MFQQRIFTNLILVITYVMHVNLLVAQLIKHEFQITRFEFDMHIKCIAVPHFFLAHVFGYFKAYYVF